VSISFDCGTKKKMRKSVDATKIITGDLGLKTFLTTNKGEKIETPRFYNKNVKLIKRLNRKLDRSLRQNNPDKYEPDFINKKGIKCKGMVKKGAKNFLKTKKYLRLEKKRNLILEKQANQLEDHHKKLARKLVDESQAIGLEDLAVKNMIKNPRLARHIQGVHGVSLFAM
jgi:putative transposase